MMPMRILFNKGRILLTVFYVSSPRAAVYLDLKGSTMSEAGYQPLSRRQQRKLDQRRKRPTRPTFLGVLGELLITAGLFVLLFVVWELYWTNLGANREAQAHRDTMAEAFEQNYTGFDGSGPDPAVPEDVSPGDDAWGMLYIPRFGTDYSVPVLDGTGPEIDSAVLGRYETSPRPGEDGNLGLAGHRQTYGAVLWDMDTLQEGDRIYLQTANGWWVYETRQVHIVDPSATEVLDPNPMDPGGPADGQWLTLTTCHPPYTVLERMITHAEKVDFVPLHEGPPEEIADAPTLDLDGEPQAAIHSPDQNDTLIHNIHEEA